MQTPDGPPPPRQQDTKPEISEVLQNAWVDLLGRPPTSPDESFFAAGGDSLHAARFAHRLREQFGVGVDIETIFTSPTIAGLTRAISMIPCVPLASIVRLEYADFQGTRLVNGSLEAPRALRALIQQQEGKGLKK